MHQRGGDILDKYEYKVRADAIRSLIGEGRYVEAVEIADTIDWKRVKSGKMLCTVSDLYKINRRFEESKDILLLAYDRSPASRAIVYSLCELSIKMGEFVQAVEYYKEFVRIAPRDTARYILQYKLYEAQDVSLEERIAVLEELKKHDYTEKWAYELAYLYHRVGLTTECVEECDEMFLWFGEGRYVMKALELKALHEPLSPEQQDRYTRCKSGLTSSVTESVLEENDDMTRGSAQVKQPTKEIPPIDPYYTGQAAQPQYDQQYADEQQMAYNAQQYQDQSQMAYDPNAYAANSYNDQYNTQYNEQYGDQYSNQYSDQYTQQYEPQYNQQQYEPQYNEQYNDQYDQQYEQPVYYQDTPVTDETKIYGQVNTDNDIEIKPVDVGNFNTINLQAALAESLKEVIGEDDSSNYSSAMNLAGDTAQPDMQEVFFNTQEQEPEKIAASMTTEFEQTLQKEDPIVRAASKSREYASHDKDVEPATQSIFSRVPFADEPLQDEVPGAVIKPNVRYRSDTHFENILSQDYDGQISMVVQEEKQVEQQITGQISIADFMNNWEQYKKDQQKQQLDRIKKKVSDETGDMFADFDEKTKAGLQERIEKAISDALQQEREDKATGRKAKERHEEMLNEAITKVVDSDEEDLEDAQPGSVVKPETTIKPEVSGETEEIEASIVEEIMNEDTPDDEDIQEESVTEEIVEDDDTEEMPSEDSEDESEAESESESEDIADSEESKEDIPEDSDAEETDEAEDDEESSKAADEDTTKEETPSDESEDKATKKKSPQNEDHKKTSKEHKHEKAGDKESREIDERVRAMTPEEKELFGPYIHHRKSRKQIIKAIDSLSMAAYTNNAIVTGEEGAGTVNLAKGLIKSVQVSDSNFSGKVAKITANSLNKKSVNTILEKLSNGALIIQRATDMKPETVKNLQNALQNENRGLIVVMEDNRADIDKFLEDNPSLKDCFNVRVDIEALDDESLVAYAKQYALEREYAIDNLGILALHTCIEERQTLDHDVTLSEVKDIVDDAIYYADKRSIGHFVDVLVGKRYDDQDMIILREKDFMH